MKQAENREAQGSGKSFIIIYYFLTEKMAFRT